MNSLRIVDLGEISCAHRISWYQGKCRRLHGHNYRIKIYVEGDNKDWMDFGDISSVGKEVIEKYDHEDITAKYGIETAEGFAERLWGEIREKLKEARIPFKEVYVEIWETAKCGVRYPA
jgi:6-pyruvoyltetrahydropterin/6-carboxytetrahydropterin synthase